MQTLATHLLAIEDIRIWRMILLAAIVIVGIMAWSVTIIMTTRARERTKQEIAAYVAEGTIDPKKAAKLIKASRKDLRKSEVPWGNSART